MQETKTFDLDAGIDCLAFANTLDARNDEKPTELLNDYDDLVAFARQTEQLDSTEAASLRSLAASDPSAAQAVLERAITVREAIYRIYSAIAAGHGPDEADLDVLNHELLLAMSHSRLATGPHGVTWTWQDDPLRLDRPLWPLARSAAELLTSEDVGRVRECAAHDCGWLFFDESRNRTRRWCSMQTCGNRAKIDRFRARQRGAEILETED